MQPIVTPSTLSMSLHHLNNHDCDCCSMTSTCHSTAPTVATSSTISGSTIGESPDLVSEKCDTCPYCPDVCYRHYEDRNEQHYTCAGNTTSKSLFSIFPSKINSASNSTIKNNFIPITKCQLRRHNSIENGVWILCGTSIYDATNYVEHHPGGVKSILRKAGGNVDCTRDMSFHSANAKKLWKQFKIGHLVPCPSEGLIENQSNNNRVELDQSEQCVIS
jgi:cytochrome b involved in lipid metabolism